MVVEATVLLLFFIQTVEGVAEFSPTGHAHQEMGVKFFAVVAASFLERDKIVNEIRGKRNKLNGRRETTVKEKRRWQSELRRSEGVR